MPFEGAIYHVTCRMLGDAESVLFTDDADRKRFIGLLSERVDQYNIRLYMLVLMQNHVHLVFETPEGNCSKFMQSLSTAYTVYYNLRHNRHGHLFDGRYKAKLETDEFRQRRRNTPLRAIAANFLIKYAGLTQREVAVLLNAGSG